ncbi:hypothetical protein COW46_03725 [Candidatus Gracilibacteria bacterium CG17_big_fil_post_rev_8_21_14_2_50_48_13]|nr:MAG: hypothetical protein COW46_03725 [Candidatus Gracilibacteria bacterium CG17_big_fil_post_rev_8_21_14_2_50_48_13]
MQLILLLLWLIGLGLWLTVMFFIRTQLRTIDSIRPRVTLIYLIMIVISLILFGVAFVNIFSVTGGIPQGVPSVQIQQPRGTPLQSTSNEKVY